MKSLTTGNATSASSNARRTSRRLSWMFSSLSLALPLILRRVAESRSVRFSNMLARWLLSRWDTDEGWILLVTAAKGQTDDESEDRTDTAQIIKSFTRKCSCERLCAMYLTVTGLVAIISYLLGSFYQRRSLLHAEENRRRVLAWGWLAVIAHMLQLYGLIVTTAGYDLG